jgi:hypothetical protein
MAVYRGYVRSSDNSIFISTKGRLFSWGRRGGETPLSDALYFIRILAESLAQNGHLWNPTFHIDSIPTDCKLVVTVSFPSAGVGVI